MGTLKLSGVLSRPVSGEVVANARISFDAVATGTVVLKGVSSVCKSAADGTYSVDLQYGDYSVQVSWSGQTQQYGVIHIDSTTPIGDLNTLLLQNIMEQQVTPEIVLEFRQLEQEMQEDLAQMEQLNAEATGAASAASLSEQNAATSEANAATHEGAAAGSATAAGQSATASASSASAADASQKKASTSEVNAATSEDNAAISERNAATSEDNAAISAGEAATSQVAASVSEVNSAANAGAAGSSATSASKSASAASASEINSKTSETNAANSSKAAGEYAQEAKDASSKVTAPLTDQGTWAIQSGYPATPSVASVWQVVDGGLDPSNPEIIWNAGDLLVYLASTGAWCRILGQQTVSGDPVPLRFDSDIVLANAKLQFVTSSTTKVDAVGLDSENSLVLGDAAIPNICLLASAPTNMFVLVPDGNGGFTKSRIYTEAFPPPSIDTSHFVPDSRKINGHALTADVDIVPSDISGLGTAAIHNVQTSPTDATSGSVQMNGAWGLGSSGLVMKDSDILSPTSIGNAFFVQGGGTDNHYGSYGAGVHLSYGTGGGNTSRLSANLFVDPTGNISVEWLEINLSDGSVKNQKLQKVYGPLNKPTAVDVAAFPNHGAIAAGTNLNTLTGTKEGFYLQQSNANATTALNYPVTQAGSLCVIKNGANGEDGCEQEYRPYSSTVVYRRTYDASSKTWSTAWDYSYTKDYPQDLSAYMTTSAANAKFLQGMQLGAKATQNIGGDGSVPSGCTVTGASTDDWDLNRLYYKPVQREINGTWATIPG